MLALIQRVSYGRVLVAGENVGEIGQGILALIGIEKNDQTEQADKMLKRLFGYRIFADEQDKMNLSVQDINGGLLLVPQFTLVADTKKGMRPSFSAAAEPAYAKELFHYLVEQAKLNYANIATGVYGADMQVELCNSGPVTFMLKTTCKKS